MRIAFYIIGLMIMVVGIVLSVKADLGVSPISAIPYTMTCVAGIELGRATIIFTVFMILLEAVLLRKQFKIINLLQLPAGTLVGCFITFCCNLSSSLPSPETVTAQFVLMVISTVVIAVGVFMYVPTGLITLAPEGAMLAIAKITNAKFSNVKLISDISMVGISCIVCLVCIGELGSVGIGSIAAAVLVGNEVKLLVRYFGKARDKILGIEK